LNLIVSIFLWQRNSDIDIQIATDTDADIGSVLHHHHWQIMFECSSIYFSFKRNNYIQSQIDTDTDADLCNLWNCRYFFLNEFEFSWFFF
jgi:hypothetical protein